MTHTGEGNMAANLTELLSGLARHRATVIACREDEQLAEAALRETPEYKALDLARCQRKAADVAVAGYTADLCEAALDAFAATGDKAPAKGVAIKLYKVYRYETDVAREWCMANAPALLVLDVKRFEKTAEQLVGAPVTIESEPRPVIAADLSDYLGEAT